MAAAAQQFDSLSTSASYLSSAPRICLWGTPTYLHQNPLTGLPTVLRPFIAHSHKYKIINLFPISYAFQPGLRNRLTLGRLPLPRKPWVYGEQVFHLFYRYSCQHNHFSAVQQTSQSTFTPAENAPLPDVIRQIRSFGSMLSPPLSMHLEALAVGLGCYPFDDEP